MRQGWHSAELRPPAARPVFPVLMAPCDEWETEGFLPRHNLAQTRPTGALALGILLTRVLFQVKARGAAPPDRLPGSQSAAQCSRGRRRGRRTCARTPGWSPAGGAAEWAGGGAAGAERPGISSRGQVRTGVIPAAGSPGPGRPPRRLQPRLLHSLCGAPAQLRGCCCACAPVRLAEVGGPEPAGMRTAGG